MLARSLPRLEALAREVQVAKGYPCDVTDFDRVSAAADEIARDLGAPSIVVYNAVSGAFGSFLEIEPQSLMRNFEVNVMGLLHLARSFTPALIAAGRGALIVTGNSSAWRGKANFAAFAPTKAAQRILAESMARDLGPKGVHVAYVTIDAVIDVPWTRAAFNKDGSKPDSFFIKPAAIADEIWHLAHQPAGAWTFQTEVRPNSETW
jgi:NAD(P)-dependent dehydrogenase (short-subunit alcohol dehydrogenase family)